MKRILYALCITTLALSLTALGEEVTNTTTEKAKAKAHSTSAVAKTSANTGARVRSTSNVSTAPVHPRSYNATRRTVSPTVAYRNNVRDTRATTARGNSLR